MPRRPRLDRPGLLHHVMNRGLARRTVFEQRADVRAFLALLAKSVRDGRIEVIAFTVITTHFHLLVRSLDGDISETMRRIENLYVRRFNRTRRRDGPLFRGRFQSFPVESVSYLHTLIRYIDQNAVQARLAARPEDYPYGSAKHVIRHGQRPRWISRAVVDAFIQPGTRQGRPREAAYRQLFAPRLSDAQRRFVEIRLHHPERFGDPLDGLLAGAPGAVREWMTKKARIADDTRPGMPVLDAQAVASALAAARATGDAPPLRTGPRTMRSRWDLLEVAILYDAAGETFGAIARRRRSTDAQIRRIYLEHLALVEENDDYRETAVDLVARLLSEQHTRMPVAVGRLAMLCRGSAA